MDACLNALETEHLTGHPMVNWKAHLMVNLMVTLTACLKVLETDYLKQESMVYWKAHLMVTLRSCLKVLESRNLRYSRS